MDAEKRQNQGRNCGVGGRGRFWEEVRGTARRDAGLYGRRDACRYKGELFFPVHGVPFAVVGGDDDDAVAKLGQVRLVRVRGRLDFGTGRV
jgi:hypothetical protein